ncbi:hypothetical protein [Methylobacterium frigidaeris]|uniref:hypothetical protein n=1 Tax=Methylobacterium frigidaeris TaxID=2038277 RepID=UPI001055D32D|nr:hypothetical protein [Methylobacterium frigidaeris]
MAGTTDTELYAPFLSLWPRTDAGNLPLVDTASGKVTARLTESGYGAVPALAACAARGTPFPPSPRSRRGIPHAPRADPRP